MGNKKWTPEEVKLLKDIVMSNGRDYIAVALQLINRSEAGIKYKIDQLRKKNELPSLDKNIYVIMAKTLKLELENHPENIQLAFKNTAKKYDYSPKTIERYYYDTTYANHPMNRSNIGVAFTLVSRRKVIKNCKNKADKAVKQNMSLWSQIKKLFK